MRTEGRPKITRIEAVEFFVELENLGMTADGCEMQYMPGETLRPMRYVLTIDTDAGVRGEFVGRRPESYNQLQRVAGRMLGRSALDRERIYGELKRQFRATINLATAPLDIALWDLAGKLYGAPIYELLGGSDDPLPAYASTHFGDASGGLDSPEAFADFAVRCKEMGYPAFKIHGWGAPIEREVRLVTAVREAVGDGMQLMHDPGCTYRTFLEALTVGKALDDANYLWYEDPYMDGGMSAFGNKKLRELLRTPILITEHIRGLEQHVDVIIAGGTDLVRVDANLDGGLTGALKICHAAEGFGLDVEIHSPGPAHRHLMASIPNSNYYEMSLVHPKAPTHNGKTYLDYEDELETIDANGCVSVPAGPGLGVSIDWDLVRRNRTGGFVFEV